MIIQLLAGMAAAVIVASFWAQAAVQREVPMMIQVKNAAESTGSSVQCRAGWQHSFFTGRAGRWRQGLQWICSYAELFRIAW